MRNIHEKRLMLYSYFFPFNEAITALKLSSPASRFSTISSASSSGSGRLSKSANDLSFYAFVGVERGFVRWHHQQRI
jgi:hypothetical protein